MIPFLIYMFIKKHGKQSLVKMGLQIRNAFADSFPVLFISLLLILLSLIPKLSKFQTRQKNNLKLYSGEYMLLMVTGATAMLASISLFISAKKNKHKAALKLAFQNSIEGLTNARSKKITGLTFSIPM